MKKFFIILTLIVVFCVGVVIGFYSNKSTKKDCMLEITRSWDSFVGVSGNELSGGKKGPVCISSLKKGDIIDYNFKKVGEVKDIDEVTKFIEILEFKDNYVLVNIYDGNKIYKENFEAKYGESYKIEHNPAIDGPQYIDSFIFNK